MVWLSFEKRKKVTSIVILLNMRMISWGAVREFVMKHPDSGVSLKSWYRKLLRKSPEGFHDLQSVFPGVDFVGNNRYVFNIKGNKYRVVAIVLFGPQKVFIRFIGTHAEYERINCKEI